MANHKHRATVARTKDYPFDHCENPEKHNPIAHGNIRRLEICRCEVIRVTNINAGVTEGRGWGAHYRAMKALP